MTSSQKKCKALPPMTTRNYHRPSEWLFKILSICRSYDHVDVSQLDGQSQTIWYSYDYLNTYLLISDCLWLTVYIRFVHSNRYDIIWLRNPIQFWKSHINHFLIYFNIESILFMVWKNIYMMKNDQTYKKYSWILLFAWTIISHIQNYK